MWPISACFTAQMGPAIPPPHTHTKHGEQRERKPITISCPPKQLQDLEISLSLHPLFEHPLASKVGAGRKRKKAIL